MADDTQRPKSGKPVASADARPMRYLRIANVLLFGAAGTMLALSMLQLHSHEWLGLIGLGWACLGFIVMAMSLHAVIIARRRLRYLRGLHERVQKLSAELAEIKGRLAEQRDK